MKKVSKRRYDQIDKLLEQGLRDADIIARIPGVKKDEIEQVRRTRGNATPETKKKKKPDPLIILESKGVLDHTHIRAAVEIREAYNIISRDVRLRIASLEARIDLIGNKPTGINTREIMLERRYKEWHEECKRQHIWILPVIHVLTEYVSLKDCDFYFGKRKGFSRNKLKEGLDCYCYLHQP